MRRALLVPLLFLISACALLDPERREIGVFDSSEELDSPVEVPATANSGEEVPVTIRTGWRDGCARKGEVETRWSGSTVTLTPFDYVEERGLCTQGILRFTHTILIRFPEPGEATVVIRGRSGFGGPLISLERAVTVE